MKTTSKLRNTALLIMLMAGAIVIAQPSAGKGSNAQNKKQGACKNIPGLTDEQKEKIEDLRLEHWKAVQVKGLDIKEKKVQLERLTIADKPDMDKVNAKIDELFALKADLAKQKAKHRNEVRSLLTPEQQAYFDMHKGKKGRGAGHGHGHGSKGKMPERACSK